MNEKNTQRRSVSFRFGNIPLSSLHLRFSQCPIIVDGKHKNTWSI